MPRWACAPCAHASLRVRPCAPADLHREHEVVGAEAGRPDDAVDGMPCAVRRDDPVGLHARDRLRHEVDVRPLQRGQERGAEQDPLAAERVVGPHLAAQRRVFELPAHERRRARGAEAPDGARVADRERQRLAVLEHEPAPELLEPRHEFDRKPPGGGVGTVLARQEPVAGALEDDRDERPRGRSRVRTARRSRRSPRPPRACRRAGSRDPIRQEWKLWPANSSAPSIRGIWGWWSCPVARISASAS